MDFNDYVNQLCREFREKRDYIVTLGEDELKKEIDRYWNKAPWYIRIFRKEIMRRVYRAVKEMI